MNTSIGRIVTFAAITAIAGTELMQGAQLAAFHLPVAAHWGQATLEPGDYKIYLPEPSTGETQFLVRGAHKTIYALPLLTTGKNISASSYLDLREINGVYFVRELSFGPAGETFVFHVPKTGRRQQIAERGDITLAVVGR